jgi:hypothetical protein
MGSPFAPPNGRVGEWLRVAESSDDLNAFYIILNRSFLELILRYYGCFFNSLDSVMALVFFSSSGKNSDQNQDPSSFEAVATTRNT